MTAKLKAAADALGQARRDLDEIRDRIADLRDERVRVAQAPCDRAEAERRIDALVERERASTAIFRPLASRITAPKQGGAALMHVNASLRDDPFGVLACIAPDLLKAAIMAEVPPGGMDENERVARLARLDADTEAAEVAEELTAREIEAAVGGTIPRRQDAPAAILLAPTDELEGNADAD